MFGGNGNEGERIRKMGNKILINITGDQRVKDSKNHKKAIDDPFADKTQEDYQNKKNQEIKNITQTKNEGQ